jgi:hypothetical protein
LNIIGSIKKKKIYAIFSPRAVIKIERKVKVTVLLDIGADINVITAKIADIVNLSVLEIISLEVETFTGYNAQLLGIYREINV